MSDPKKRAKRKKSRRRRQKAARGAPAVGAQVLPRGPVDAGEAPGQGREAGPPPAGPEPSIQREDEDPIPDPIDPLGPEATDLPGRPEPVPSLVRPYRFRIASNPREALEFATWIRAQAGQMLGFAIHDNTFGLVNQDEGWQAPLVHGDLTSQIVRSNLIDILRSPNAPQLVVQHSVEALAQLGVVFEEIPPRELARLVTGNAKLLRSTTGRAGSPTSPWPSPADEAYDAYTCEKHWGDGAPAFYRQVAIPRTAQEFVAHLTPSEGTPWRIVYEDLFLRVVAHYTREPMLVAAFMDGADPCAAVAKALELDDPEIAYSAVLWAALNFDSVVLESLWPNAQILTSEPLRDLRERVERRLAVLVLNTIQQREDYIRDREARTLYGQRIPWNLSLPEMLRDRYLRSVQEILDVAAVSFWKDEAMTVWSVQENLLDRTIRLRGTVQGKREEWQQIIEDVAPIGNPLSVPLTPTVIWGE